MTGILVNWSAILQTKIISAGNLEQFMGVKNQIGIGLSYRPARLHRLTESIPWNRFLGYLNVYKFGLWLRLTKKIRDFQPCSTGMEIFKGTVIGVC
jgi:hypothetical protein